MKQFLPFIWGRRETDKEPTWEELVILLDEVGAAMEDLKELGFVALYDIANNHLIIRKEVVL